MEESNIWDEDEEVVDRIGEGEGEGDDEAIDR